MLQNYKQFIKRSYNDIGIEHTISTIIKKYNLICYGGWAIHLYIKKADGVGIYTEDEIIEFCKQSLPDYAIPASVEFVTELPRNPMGKVLKKALRESYQGA